MWNDHEGDIGRTFTIGNDPEMKQCVHDLEGIFSRCVELWKDKQATGAEIYDFAGKEADDLGWILNTQVSGHRLSDFPHHQYSKDSLLSLTSTPGPYRWVLELQIKHPKKNFGGFYEDLLM